MVVCLSFDLVHYFVPTVVGGMWKDTIKVVYWYRVQDSTVLYSTSTEMY